MPPFPEPSFDYTYDPAVETAALRDWRKNKPGRQIPARRSNRLLLATWNVANLGLQKRTDADHALIAEIQIVGSPWWWLRQGVPVERSDERAAWRPLACSRPRGSRRAATEL